MPRVFGAALKRLFAMSCIAWSMSLPSVGFASGDISYVLDEDWLYIKGPFNSAEDQVVLRGLQTDNMQVAEISLHEAQGHIGSFFQLDIGEGFSELFGDRAPINLEAYGGRNQPREIIYDYATFRGACTRSDNGKMVLMIDLKQAGTLNAANPPETLFIYSDFKDRVKYEIINRDLWTDATCLDDARNSAMRAEFARQTANALVEALSRDVSTMDPSALDAPGALTVKPLPGDPRPEIERHLGRFSSYYFPDYCRGREDAYVEECAKSQSGIETVFQGATFDIHRARFIQYCASAGVDFLHDKKSDEWTAIFRSPPGCSKYHLCEPSYQSSDGEKLLADLPRDCIHWGSWQSVVIDLKTFEVFAAPHGD